VLSFVGLGNPAALLSRMLRVGLLLVLSVTLLATALSVLRVLIFLLNHCETSTIAEARRALQIDPLSTSLNGNLGSVFVFTHQWDKAIEQLRSSIDLDPNYWFDYYFLGRAYVQKGRFPEAIAALKKGISLGGTTEVWSSLGDAYALSGERDEAQKVIEHLKELSVQEYVAPYNFAVIYAGLAEKDEAFAWLNRAYQERSYLLTYLTVDERLNNLHSDPRFDELRRRVGLPRQSDSGN
jgi:tetratricopeptide (TPR) repeat protein